MLNVGGTISVQQTFDALAMDSELPAPWAVRGTGLGEARIVALPTSVDRSVRIRSGTDGGATIACLPADGADSGDVAISFDYSIGRTYPPGVTVFSLQADGAPTLGLILGPTGAPIGTSVRDVPSSGSPGPGASGSPPAGVASPGSHGAGSWQHVDLGILAADAVVTWRAHDTAGAVTGAGSQALQDGIGADFDALCFHSPDGAPDAWVVIDDLVVSR